MISITSKGDYNKTLDFLRRIVNRTYLSDFDKYGIIGVEALSQATPIDTGLSASSWYYKVINDAVNPGISWHNNDIESGEIVVILIQYGHGTGTGGYVQGYDFINPTMRPIFDKIAEDIWAKIKA